MNWRNGAKLSVLLILALLAKSALAGSGYWVWKDANGVTNFSQQKPKNHKAKFVGGTGPYGYTETTEDSRRPGGALPPPPSDKPVKKQAAPKAKKKINPDAVAAAAKAKIERQVAAAKQKRCEQARRNIAEFKRHPRIRMTGKNGTVHVMSPQEKQAQLDQSQAVIQSDCSS